MKILRMNKWEVIAFKTVLYVPGNAHHHYDLRMLADRGCLPFALAKRFRMLVRWWLCTVGGSLLFT